MRFYFFTCHSGISVLQNVRNLRNVSSEYYNNIFAKYNKCPEMNSRMTYKPAPVEKVIWKSKHCRRAVVRYFQL